MAEYNNATPLTDADRKSKSRGWHFVINNYFEEDEDFIGELYFVEGAKYVVAGREIAPTTLTPHLQCYVYFNEPVRFSKMKDLHPTAAWFKARGSAQQNRAYCSKNGDFLELGEIPLTPSDGAKMTNTERWTLAKEGRFEELDPENVKIYEYIYAKYQTVEDRPILDNVWIYGPSGCGKSSRVRQEHEAFYSKPMNKWWDGYQREDVVVLDDFDPNHGSYLSYYLKIWADHYSFNAEVKGGMMHIRPKTIIITSQYTIEDCFRLKDGSPDHPTIDAISRRFKRLNYSGFFGQFVDPNFIGNPVPAPIPDVFPMHAAGFVPPPVATDLPDLDEDELRELLLDI